MASTNPTEQPLPTVPDSVADVNAATATFRWSKTVELGYEEGAGDATSAVENEEPVCFHCGKVAEEAESKKLSKCAKCGVGSYW